MAEIVPEGDPRRAPKPHPLSDFVQCEKCGLYSLKDDVHHFQGCSNDPDYVKPKTKSSAKAAATAASPAKNSRTHPRQRAADK